MENMKTDAENVQPAVQTEETAAKKKIEIEKTGFIVCDGLVRIFKSSLIEVMALQGLDLTIQKGEYIAVVGKSGSGKSTLMNIISGLDKPTAGKVYVDGKDLTRFTEKEMMDYRKNTIGFVWQKSARNLFPYLTSVDNVELAMQDFRGSAKAKRQRAMELLKLTGIDHKKDAYLSQMSGGEQQRVSIAVALANNPQILLADEPTGAVDSKTANALEQLFRKLNKEMGLTILIVTHDTGLAAKTDRTIMINDGKISTEQVEDSHYFVMDKANRVQLGKDMLREAGITDNKVKIAVEDGRIVITKD